MKRHLPDSTTTAVELARSGRYASCKRSFRLCQVPGFLQTQDVFDRYSLSSITQPLRHHNSASTPMANLQRPLYFPTTPASHDLPQQPLFPSTITQIDNHLQSPSSLPPSALSRPCSSLPSSSSSLSSPKQRNRNRERGRISESCHACGGTWFDADSQKTWCRDCGAVQ